MGYYHSPIYPATPIYDSCPPPMPACGPIYPYVVAPAQSYGSGFGIGLVVVVVILLIILGAIYY